MTDKQGQVLNNYIAFGLLLLTLIGAVISAENRFVHEVRYAEDQKQRQSITEYEQRRSDARMERLEAKIDRLLERSGKNEH